jgi:hypothetical protein
LYIKPKNPSELYITNYKKSKEFKKLPAIYANPKYNPLTKRLEFGSFEYELEQAKKRPNAKYYLPITDFYWNKITNKKQNLKKFPLVFTNGRYNPYTKRLEFNSLDYELEKSGYFEN